MEELVVQGVGPARRLVLVHGHGRVVGEVGVVQHLKHLVAADLVKKTPRFVTRLEFLCSIDR